MARATGTERRAERVPPWTPAAFFAIAAVILLVSLVFAATGAVSRETLAVLLGVAMIVAAGACASRAILSPDERAGWLTLAVGKIGWGITSIAYLVDSTAVTDFPTLADVGLVFYPAIMAGFILLARRRLVGLPRALWLDAAIGGFALAALGAAVLHGPLIEDNLPEGGGTSALVYTLADLALAGFVAVSCLFAGWQRGKALYVLGAGALLTAVADAAWAADVASGMARV